MTWTVAIMAIIEIVRNVSKVLPKWYDNWKKRKDLAYIKERDKIRRAKAKLLQRIKDATGDEKHRLIEIYLDRYIRN